MKIEIQITIKSDDGQIRDQEQIACLQCGTLTPEELGMNLAEAKELTRSVQETMGRCQTAEFVKQQSVCPHCDKKRSLKDHHEIVYRTLFGKLKRRSPRLYRCPCQGTAKRTESPLAATITTAFVESPVNQVVSQRGAHLLFQVRTCVLNHQLRDTFCRWYPKMKAASTELGKRAA